MDFKTKILFVCILITYPLSVKAQITMPSYFSDNMVLQRNEPISVFGMALPGEKIEGRFRSEKITTTADSQGNWALEFKMGNAGGPFLWNFMDWLMT